VLDTLFFGEGFDEVEHVDEGVVEAGLGRGGGGGFFVFGADGY
jgi:hypothetical protein